MGDISQRRVEITKECKISCLKMSWHLCDLVRSFAGRVKYSACLSPVTVCGDIHGQFIWFIEELFRTGVVCRTKVHLHGRHWTRAFQSGDPHQTTLVLKARWPDRNTLLRGNHESKTITSGVRILWWMSEQVRELLMLMALLPRLIFTVCTHW